MKAVKFILTVCLAIFLSNTPQISAQEKTEAQPKSPETEQTPPTAPQSSDAQSNFQDQVKKQANDKYRNGFQDTIEVQVYKHPELSQTVNVSPDGTVLLPRIEKPIVAVCKTERELADTITTLYKSYLRNPFVNVRAVEQRSQPFAVVGAVEKPGSFYLNRKIRLLELLAFAGGPDVENAGSKIQVARVGNVSGCSNAPESADEENNIEFYGYNLNEVLKGKENPWMQPGDIVSVLIAEEAYVVGNVMKPSKVVLREQKTLMQAIAEAGGVNSTAKTDKVVIQRQEPGSKTKSELVFNLKDIRDQKIPDPQLQANDIVVVANDKVKSLGKEFWGIIKGGVPILLY